MLPAQEPIVISHNQIHYQMKQQVANNLQQIGYPVSHEQLTSFNHETPMTSSPEFQKIGANIMDAEDLAHLITTTVKRAEEIRTTKSSNPLKILLNKFKRRS